MTPLMGTGADGWWKKTNKYGRQNKQRPLDRTDYCGCRCGWIGGRKMANIGGKLRERVWHIRRTCGHKRRSVLHGGIIEWAPGNGPHGSIHPQLDPMEYECISRILLQNIEYSWCLRASWSSPWEATMNLLYSCFPQTRKRTLWRVSGGGAWAEMNWNKMISVK